MLEYCCHRFSSFKSGNVRNLLAVSILFCLTIAAFSNPGPQRPGSARGQTTPMNRDSQATRLGYLISLKVQNGRMELVSAADIDNYIENKHLAAEDDWAALLFDAAGNCIGTRLIQNPFHIFPHVSADQEFPLTVKIPRLDGLSWVSIYDQSRQEMLKIPIDDSFRKAATANRERFLAHDRENQRLIKEEASARARNKAALVPGSQTLQSFENLRPEERDRLTTEISIEMEQLLRFGPEVMNLARSQAGQPEELERPLINLRRLPAARAGEGYRSFAPAGAFSLTGQLTDLDTGAPLAGATIWIGEYDTNFQNYHGVYQTTDASGYYSCPVDLGYANVWGPTFAAPPPGQKQYVVRWGGTWIKIEGNATLNFKAIPGINLSGTVTNMQGQGISGAVVSCQAQNLDGLYLNITTSSTGSYAIVAPLNRPVDLSLSVPSPYIAPSTMKGIIFSGDTVQNFAVDTGWVISGVVTGDGGATISGASVLLRQINGTTAAPPGWSANTNASGQFSLSTAKNLAPNTFILSAYATNYLRKTISLQISENVIQNFQLVKGFTVSGTVRDSGGIALSNCRVRAYQGTTFVTSALTTTSGTYSFDLPAGTYDLQVIPDFRSSSKALLAPATAANVTVDGPLTRDFVLSAADGTLTVKLYFSDVNARTMQYYYMRFELFQSGKTVYATRGYAVLGTGGYDSARGKYYYNYLLHVVSGQYGLIVYPAGCQPVTLTNISIAGSSNLSLDLPAPYLWSGTLRGFNGSPLPNIQIVWFDDLADVWNSVTTNASGVFTTPMTPNGFIKFYTNEGSRNILHTERFGNVTAGRNSDCILDEFPSFTDSGSALTQVFGTPDRESRWNIVMIGDGYTGITETYTDTNGNGRWDGTLFYDINSNGVWDTGEPYQRYGTAPAPSAGVNPTLTNEPFTDLNGDGAPNFYDQTLYDRNSLDTARSLFGQDEWQRHRDAFNIFRIRILSNQAGHDIRDINNNVVIARDTALGTYLNSPDRGYIFSGDNSLVSQYINQYVPECDTRIVLVNQPIYMGRVTSYIFQYGGDVSGLCNSYVIAHEMGHNVGLLADEYTEFAQTYSGSESTWRNVTALTDPNQIPWRHLLTPGKEIPSIPYSSGIGLFEGAQYVTGGKYRPTNYCMMVSGDRYCPVCTEEIEIRLADITGVIPSALPRLPAGSSFTLFPAFSWDSLEGVSHYLLELERTDGGGWVASFDVYNNSFVMPFALMKTDYRWRIRPGSPSRWGTWSGWIAFHPYIVDSDFNRDGNGDIVWRLTTAGDINVWFTNGATITGDAWLPRVTDQQWQISGIGDLNGDGNAEMIWRHTVTGDINVWFMNGTAFTADAWLPRVSDLQWQIHALGDINGDGRSEIIWRHTTSGDINVWFLNGAVLTGDAWLPRVATQQWQIQGAGDLNGDGKADIIWRHTVSGDINVWFMNGTTITTDGWLPRVASAQWQIKAFPDINGDHRAEILWRHTVSGDINVWFVNGAVLTGDTWLPRVSNQQWQIFGPK
jgi:hypothetical protein